MTIAKKRLPAKRLQAPRRSRFQKPKRAGFWWFRSGPAAAWEIVRLCHISGGRMLVCDTVDGSTQLNTIDEWFPGEWVAAKPPVK